MEDADAAVATVIGASVTLVYIFQDVLLRASEAFGEFMFAFGSTWGYLGAFVISVFGNFTVIFPVPYAAAIFLLGAFGLNPILLGISAGIGAGIGEFSAYILGRGVSETSIREKYGNRLDSMRLLVEKYGFWTIFSFAATPLPDDLIMIPLGMIKYSFRRAFVACFLGKIVLCTVLGYAGQLGLGWLIGGSENVWSMMIGVAGVIGVSYLTIRIDWVETLDKIQKEQRLLYFWFILSQPIRTAINTVKEFPVPSAILTAFTMMSVTLFLGNLLMQLVAALISTCIIVVSIFFELKKTY
ncbi:MAG: DedA family protein [Candidatus Ranarchaeia archaeon]